MKTPTRAWHPDSRPETPHRTREDEETSGCSVRPWPQVEGGRKRPPSILRRSWPERVPHKADPPRSSRHVRFQEPLEVAVHYIARREPTAAVQGGTLHPVPRRSSLLLWLSLCILLGVALGLYCGWAEPTTTALENLWAQLRILILHLWHMALSGWHCFLQL
ncbi:nutritionally-regulated adipose and cardiac enriched protein homolog isoform X2 [Fukomys damarensis]|uniref:nutritionally-regulated adipose and cardiac enriched protein homolog isoform X2 n=1 Tax=Fukomys damarensis TaxID=885580 RepID=UPI00053F7B2B|nr:nutritionally-regulated adipose and cardiac enriched protein homolog isoform X2 [Fukomys damarensis]